MKIVILSTDPKLYSTQRLVEATRKRGHTAEVINPLRCYMNITSHKPSVHYRERILDGVDAIIPRIGASVTFYGTAVVRQFEMTGVYSVNESVAISRSRDKLRSMQLLARKGISLPVTGFGHSSRYTKDLIKLVGGAPLVVKLLEGTQGRGVVLAETDKAAESVIDAFREMEGHFLVQEFIREAKATDIRCLVVGDKVVASMLRRAKDGDFRSGVYSRDDLAEPIKITPEERSTATRAAGVIGLNVAAVDMLRSNHGPVVVGVNSSPGLQGIEKISGTDVAGRIVEFIEKNARKGKTRTAGKG